MQKKKNHCESPAVAVTKVTCAAAPLMVAAWPALTMIKHVRTRIGICHSYYTIHTAGV